MEQKTNCNPTGNVLLFNALAIVDAMLYGERQVSTFEQHLTASQIKTIVDARGGDLSIEIIRGTIDAMLMYRNTAFFAINGFGSADPSYRITVPATLKKSYT